MSKSIEPNSRNSRASKRAATLGAIATALVWSHGIAAAADTETVRGTHGQKAVAHDPIRASLERQSERAIKRLYRNCNREALESRLANGEIALCSVVYEVLLTKHFEGDFHALLDWSNSDRDERGE